MTDLNESHKAWTLIFICWIISLVATCGSLFFSEVMGYPPCVLCWYQRIAMYPLVLLFPLALMPLDKKVFKYTLPLVITGWIIALYHNLLHYKIVPESASPCREGVSCSDVWINWFGFVTIPILSFCAFTIILTLLIVFYRRYYK